MLSGANNAATRNQSDLLRVAQDRMLPACNMTEEKRRRHGGCLTDAIDLSAFLVSQMLQIYIISYICRCVYRQQSVRLFKNDGNEPLNIYEGINNSPEDGEKRSGMRSPHDVHPR